MPAHSKEFPWPPHYCHIKFFEGRMRAHGRVATLTAVDRGVYEITLVSGKVLRVFICECYSYGVAEYIETIDNLGELDAIVVNSDWCGYTAEAKRLCRDKKVGLFKIGDFMAAIHKAEFWSHLNRAEIEDFKKRGWLLARHCICTGLAHSFGAECSRAISTCLSCTKTRASRKLISRYTANH
jgi:hypothetical protein